MVVSLSCLVVGDYLFHYRVGLEFLEIGLLYGCLAQVGVGYRFGKMLGEVGLIAGAGRDESSYVFRMKITGFYRMNR